MEFRVGDDAIRITTRRRADLIGAVQARLTLGHGFALATLNLDHLVKLRRSRAFLDAYLKQDFVVADGNPVVWLARLARQPVELMPGSDLVIPLAATAARCGARVALVGSTDAALNRAAEALLQAVPGLAIGAMIAPPMGFDPMSPAARALLQTLQDRQIGLCFLALGAPRQEMLAAQGRTVAPSVGFVSVGAGLDFLAGSQVRAPIWVRRLSLEWLWRMLQSPTRMIPRYAACAALLPSLAAEALHRRGTP